MRESYNLVEYRDNVVLKTLLIKEDKIFNLTHMALGMGSELMSELPIADKLMNETNRIEELGDIEFFVIGYAYFEDIEIPNKIPVNSVNALIEPLDLLNHYIGCIQTIVKKELVSGVKKLDGVVVTKEKLSEIVYNVLFGIQMYADYWNLDMVNVVRPANARKLNVRYDGGGFTAENSLDRDYTKEDAALKGAEKKSIKIENHPLIASNYPLPISSYSRESLFNNNLISQIVYDYTENLSTNQFDIFIEKLRESNIQMNDNSEIKKLVSYVTNSTKNSIGEFVESSTRELHKGDKISGYVYDITKNHSEIEYLAFYKLLNLLELHTDFDLGRIHENLTDENITIGKNSRIVDYKNNSIGNFVFNATVLLNESQYRKFAAAYNSLELKPENLDGIYLLAYKIINDDLEHIKNE